jgi:hypothetical protein
MKSRGEGPGVRGQGVARWSYIAHPELSVEKQNTYDGSVYRAACHYPSWLPGPWSLIPSPCSP